jgi:hypothetical protein
VTERTPETSDELRELADLLDDLQTHKGWHAVVAMAQKMYGATITVERIASVLTTQTTADRIAVDTAELMAARRAAQQLVELPETLAKKYREAATKIDRAMSPRMAPDLGPDVELTR